MTHYTITPACIEADYHGAGRAWAAVEGDRVVALRYMRDRPIDDSELPGWITTVIVAADGLDSHGLPVIQSRAGFAAMAGDLAARPDCPKPPRRDRYRPAELLKLARVELATRDSVAFVKYRDRCRDELAELGNVVSGMCSCAAFFSP